MLAWLSENYIEIAGVLLSLAYLYFSIRQNILLWPVGILSAIIYILVFYEAKFYADMSLNFYYFAISIYGWVNWSNARQQSGSSLPVSDTGKRRAVYLIFTTFVLFILIAQILDRLTDSPLPYWDALTTAGSIVATWMLTKKILQHWIIWIIVDLISAGLYIYRGLYPTSFLFFVYTGMAIVGYLQWRRSEEYQNNLTETEA